ncbi:hypothetical protein Nepgr_032376 [Nepenthes gracilis]|uniref:Uncharacterized protein n=1 Tax=Nepenthes gracilis TaxID=150966 RepID=A0AAD3TKB2_NEPGR|nr:hypothetical protein Nepgr_032376 [Nepenthes gracilis]
MEQRSVEMPIFQMSRIDGEGGSVDCAHSVVSKCDSAKVILSQGKGSLSDSETVCPVTKAVDKGGLSQASWSFVVEKDCSSGYVSFAHVCVEVGGGANLPSKVRLLNGRNPKSREVTFVEVNIDYQ